MPASERSLVFEGTVIELRSRIDGVGESTVESASSMSRLVADIFGVGVDKEPFKFVSYD